MCDKIRSILTRRGVKARDFIDIYLISKNFGIELEDLKEDIIDKILFMFDLYEKYRDNFNEKKRLLKTKEIFTWGNEKDLLLAELEIVEKSLILKDFLSNKL